MEIIISIYITSIILVFTVLKFTVLTTNHPFDIITLIVSMIFSPFLLLLMFIVSIKRVVISLI